MNRRDLLKSSIPILLVPRLAFAQQSSALHPILTLGDALGASATFRVGGSDLTKLVPTVRVEKWDEAWIKLNHRDTIVGAGARQELVDGRPTLTVGDIKHVFYQRSTSSLEYELHLNSRPVHNWIRLEIQDSGGLRYCPQAAPIPQDLADGVNRPAEVIGSIAIYYDKSGNVVGGPQYGIGKFGHWYRWKVTDKNGVWAWCEDLRIDIEDGKTYLIAGLPASFMELAAYPVCVGPYFGNDNIGASTASRAQDLLVLKGYTGISGTATAVGAYFTDGDGQEITLGIYSGASNPLSLEDDTGGVTVTNNTPGWYSDSLDSSVTLNSGTTYYPALCLAGFVGSINYDSDTNASDRVTASYVSGTLPASISPTITETSLYSIRVDYTAGGGATGAQMIIVNS